MFNRILEKFKKKESEIKRKIKPVYTYYGIEAILKQWIDEIGMTEPIEYSYRTSIKVLTICTNRPGWMIGLHGETINKYRALLEKDYSVVDIEFVETCGIIHPYKEDYE